MGKTYKFSRHYIILFQTRLSVWLLLDYTGKLMTFTSNGCKDFFKGFHATPFRTPLHTGESNCLRTNGSKQTAGCQRERWNVVKK